jgi:REP element-mobilizing transposase RayT
MPRRNVIRHDGQDVFYHVYARGGNKRRIFLDEEDYLRFLQLLERYLSPEEIHDKYGVPYPNFYNKVDLLAFCLMPNHFHLLVYQRQVHMLTSLMQSVMTSYSRYFNQKYHRTGPLFESRFRASAILDETYLEHISRYIHLNPQQWRNYEYSSMPYYLQQDTVSWVRPERILSMFRTPADYLQFVEDYQENKKMMDILKKELANET